MQPEQLIGELLTSLETAEVRLMEWGFSDVSHTDDEIVDLFARHPELGQAFRDEAGPGGEALWVDDLVSTGLLYRVSFGPPRIYRSRFAESARLLVKLRQRFSEKDWSTAPELVSDVRYFLGPRRFPVRNIDTATVWEALSSSASKPELQRAALEALCGGSEAGIHLAGFQVRASQRILERYTRQERASGTVITAGTGGGKTKAFYIPALMGIVADLARDPTALCRVLSVYPRNVLLADQFSEATQLAMVVNAAMKGRLERPIRVGALIGDVPFTADFEGDRRNDFQTRSWRRPRGIAGHRVPHLRDPLSGKPLIWLDEDRRAGRTVLRLEDQIDRVVVPDGVLALTRSALLARPPDMLLTSIEMINKELSSEVGREILGFGARQSPLKMILLDEIHTYEGLTGAQVPWILRRLAYWTRGHSRSSSLHVVGLSATLQDAPNHLATLTGIPEGLIVEISPDASVGELTTEGQEYNVVLKAHPGSGSGVLATSIQTVMLGARLLTPHRHVSTPGAIDAGYFFGRKVFGFTDNLDVVNRWLPDFSDAEVTRRLASLRATQTDDEARSVAGQTWRLSEQLGHDLNVSVQVGRTSSQDPGVDSNADVVLATSALEVGFDDDEVGMVVQHKAPRSAASFLQRKGRAGRRKGMRPWTIVVLSEHGRDRWAFRDSEHLFSPSLTRLSLPVFNPYVLRIQAAWFLVDWIARRVGRGVPGLYLARRKYFDEKATSVVRQLIEKPEMRASLSRELADWIRFSEGGVRVSDAEGLAQDLLWKPPRAILRRVVPALWNHLEGDVPAASKARERLLPQFIPERTWEVLDTQDVDLVIENLDIQTMDVRRALREFVPGRVSRRFAIGPREPSKWLAWSAQLTGGSRPDQAAVDELIGASNINEELPGLSIFQPTDLAVTNVPAVVKKSSNSEWQWNCSVREVGESNLVTLHAGPVARTIFERGSSWLHRERSGLRVYRYSSSFRYELSMERTDARRGLVQIVQPQSRISERKAAIGYVRSVDGIELRINSDILQTTLVLPVGLRAALRPRYFRHSAINSPTLRRETSVFGVGLLATSALGMILATALRQHVSLPEAWALIKNRPAAARKVLSSILSGESETDSDTETSPSRSIREITMLWENPTVSTEMDSLVACLWNEPNDDWYQWLRTVFLETVRSAVHVAVQSVLPEVPENDFSVEVIHDQDRATIWILEAEAGGIGVIDRLLTETNSDPALFDIALESSLTSCTAERIVENVSMAVRGSLRRSSELATAFAEVRAASSYSELDTARNSLLSALTAAGCDVDKEAVTGLVGKVLMPGSSKATDHWLRRLTAGRTVATERLSMEVDPRLWAYWTNSSPKRRRLMEETLRAQHGKQPSDAQIMASVIRLTLDPCKDSCPNCLGATRELQGLLPSRRLANQWLDLNHIDQVIDVGPGFEWEDRLDQMLAEGRRLRLRFDTEARDRVSSALAERLAQQYDRGYVLSNFRITAVRRRGDTWELLIRTDDDSEDS